MSNRSFLVNALIASSLVGALLPVMACSGPFAALTPAPRESPADTVLYGEHIYTVDPATSGADAVALRGTEIVAVGSRADVEVLVGENTRVIELGDRALTPGFIDAHGHLSMVVQTLGMLNASSPPVGSIESIQDIIEAFKERIVEQNIPSGQLVMGYGYDDSLLAEGRHPDRHDLDKISTEHPIVILHVSGHLATSNSAALAVFGFDENTQDPYGGVIRRQEGTQIPTGVLEEVAAHMGLGAVMTTAGRPSPADFARDVHRGLAYHAAFGVTTIQDGASQPEAIQGLRAVAAVRPFEVDVAAYRVFGSEKDAADLEAVGFSRDYVNGLRVAGVKFVLDGSPQGRTAWLTRPYDEGPPGVDPNYVAYSMVKPEFYKTHVKRLIDAKIPVIAHANGDAAIDLMIEGVDAAVSETGAKDHRSVTIHAQLTREDQLDAMKRLGIIPSFFAAHSYFWGDWHRKSFGDDRAMRISPTGSALDRDILFTIHNDAPIVPPDMMRLMEIAVGRKTRAGVVLGEDQRLSFEEALHSVTLAAAYQYFEEDRKGSISVGKQADLVILERDPKAGPIDQIAEIGIVETIARGRTVFQAP